MKAHLDRLLYECDDCFDEALMDIGHYDGLAIIDTDDLQYFNSAYKREYQHNHIERVLPVRAPNIHHA